MQDKLSLRSTSYAGQVGIQTILSYPLLFQYPITNQSSMLRLRLCRTQSPKATPNTARISNIQGRTLRGQVKTLFLLCFLGLRYAHPRLLQNAPSEHTVGCFYICFNLGYATLTLGYYKMLLQSIL